MYELPDTLSGRLYISKASCKRTRHCWMFYPFAHPIACSWEFFPKVLNWSNVELLETDATTPSVVGSCWVCLHVVLVSFLRFFICCISCLICQINTKREYFSRCALSDFEGLMLIIHDLYRIPQRTRMALSNSCAAALCFCDFSIFQEEPLKDFGYNWFLLNRFVFMGLSCSLDLTILENFRNKKQVWSYLWKRNQPSLTLKWIRSV